VRRLARVLTVAALLGAGSSLPAACSSDDDAPAPRETPPAAITRSELDQHLLALQRIANRHRGTRAAGSPGYAASADYVAARLADAGWRVRRQTVPFTSFSVRRASVRVGGRPLARQDFQVLSYSGSGRASGALRAVGDGCDASDFTGLGGSDIPLAVSGGRCITHDKAKNAERAGRRALLVIESSATSRGVQSVTLVFPDVRIPVVGVARRAVRGGGAARVNLDAVERRTRTENVIAETPGGSGDGVVMAGGHLDSVISGPGINDNGSGVALLIEAAEAIGPDPPGARVRVGFWAAEELALIGSRRYVRSLGSGERRRVRAYLNFDMVGSPNPVPQLYGDGDPRLSAVLRQAAGATKLGEADVAGASDHAPFDQAGIAVNGLYTGADERGPGGRPRDPCYHLVCDTERGVNLGVLLRMARTATAALATLSRRHR
jgi:hypothetical protein